MKQIETVTNVAHAFGTRTVVPVERVLLVDDDDTVREVLGQYLQVAGFEVLQTANGDEALGLIERERPDLVILDILLPGLDGLEICRRLRTVSGIPVLMLTARAEDQHKATAFTIGVDDYVTKPFSPREIILRVRAILRRVSAVRSSAVLSSEELYVADLHIDLQAREVERCGSRVELTAKEFDLLLFLVRHPRQVFSRQQLLDHVWDFAYYGDANTVTVYIHRLRDKLEVNPAAPRHFKTIRSIGYKFEL